MRWRIYLGRAALATLALVLSPATVSFPLAARGAVVLGLGLAAMLTVNYLHVRHALAPLERLAAMRSIDPLAPGRRSGLEASLAEVGALAKGVRSDARPVWRRSAVTRRAERSPRMRTSAGGSLASCAQRRRGQVSPSRPSHAASMSAPRSAIESI